MKIKQYSLSIAFYLCALCSLNVAANAEDNYAVEFKNRSLQSCDTTFHKLENKCSDMICQDILANAWAECWKRSMNKELDQRLLKLKSNNNAEFHFEMVLQESFNQAIHNLCGKDCGSGGTMKGIPYNFCRVEAYKYRTAQAMQINENQLSIPIEKEAALKKSRKEKIKDTRFFNTFSEQLCKMPKNIWALKNLPVDCKKKTLMELDSFTFTDDTCDLS
jgi:hypothetical protein